MSRAMNSMLGLACLYTAFDVMAILSLPRIFEYFGAWPS